MTEQNEHQLPFIPHSRPTLGPEEIQAVSDVISSGYVAEGDVVRRFEQAFADYHEIRHAVATNSGTSALHLVLLALDIGPGDEVIIPSYVCCALLNAVNYTGARPVLVDIVPETFNIDPSEVKTKISNRTKAIIVPHLFGLPADLDQLLDLDVPLIEDCAQALGAEFDNRTVGTFGVAAIYSFYATKVMSTGEGGMVVTGSGDIANRIKDLKTYDQKKNYSVRYNYKMTDFQAAMGLCQLDRLDSFLRRRRAIAHQYARSLKDLDLHLPLDDPGHIYFRFVIGLDADPSPWIDYLAGDGIGCDRPIFLPLHRQLQQEGCPMSEKAWNSSLSISIYPSLSDNDVERIIDAIRKIASKYS